MVVMVGSAGRSGGCPRVRAPKRSMYRKSAVRPRKLPSSSSLRQGGGDSGVSSDASREVRPGAAKGG